MLHRDVTVSPAKRAIGALGLPRAALATQDSECRIYKRYVALSAALDAQLPPRGYIRH